MDEAIAKTKTYGIHTLNWFALKDNIIGNRFYQTLGAKIVSEKPKTHCNKVAGVQYNLTI